jgi:hypothetical protein
MSLSLLVNGSRSAWIRRSGSHLLLNIPDLQDPHKCICRVRIRMTMDADPQYYRYCPRDVNWRNGWNIILLFFLFCCAENEETVVTPASPAWSSLSLILEPGGAESAATAKKKSADKKKKQLLLSKPAKTADPVRFVGGREGCERWVGGYEDCCHL